MSSFLIKLIAIITMAMDHTGDALVGHISILNVLGRIAFPLFAFQLVVGYSHTKNFSKYCLRLFIFALISQVPFSIFCYNYSGTYTLLNVFFTLLIGLLALRVFDYNFSYLLEKIKIKDDSYFKSIASFAIKFVLISLLVFLAQLLNVDYQAWGILLILFIYIFYNKSNKLYFILGYPLVCIARFIPYFSLLPINILIAEIIFTIVPIIFMLLYNNKKGPSIKYFFYAFYPVHLMILNILTMFK